MNHEKGFSASSLLVGFAAIGMALLYTQNQNSAVSQKIKEAKTQELSLNASNMHLSNLSLLKAALQPAKRGTKYLPTLYAGDYFADKWAFEEQKSYPAKGIAIKGENLKIDVMDVSVLESSKIAKAMATAGMNLNEHKATQELSEFVLNYDAVHPFWVRSVDVNSKIISDQKTSMARGRIAVDAPVPTNLKVAIKAPGESSFKIYQKDDVLPDFNASGKYAFRVLGRALSSIRKSSSTAQCTVSASILNRR